MVAWPEVLISSIISIGTTLIAAYVAFRVQIERRLVRLETNLDIHPPKDIDLRVRTLENEMAALSPLKNLLIQYGEAAAKSAFERGQAK